MKKRLCLLLLPLLVFLQVEGQEQLSYQQLADRYFITFQYQRAMLIYERLCRGSKVKAANLYKLGYSYEITGAYDKALGAYARCMQQDSTADTLQMRTGNLLKQLQKYTQAKTAYTTYAAKYGTSPLLQNRLAGCDSAQAWLHSHAIVTLQPASSLNTSYADWGAVVHDSVIVFTTEFIRGEALDNKTQVLRWPYPRTGLPYSKIFAARSDGKNIGLPGTRETIVSDIGTQVNNSPFHEGAAVFSSRGDTVYFTITHATRRNALTESPPRHYVYHRVKEQQLELQYSVKSPEGHWQKAVSCPFNNVKAYSVGQPALSKDGSILYFVSDMPGGYGQTDIWYAEKDSAGNWGQPKNCGSAINTSGNEMFPVVNDSNRLHFSSDGWPGMGGLDLFAVTGAKQQWQQPKNLLPPFNSSFDDFYFFRFDTLKGFLSSNRQNGVGSDDIYVFQLPVEVAPPKVLNLLTTVYRAKDSSVVQDAIVALTNLQRRAMWRQRTDTRGQTMFILERAIDYELVGSFATLQPDSAQFSTNIIMSGDTVYQSLYLREHIVPEKTYKVGDHFVLEGLYYDFDKYNIRPDAAIVLNKLQQLLLKYPTMKIELSSHTDSRGSKAYNERLSAQRAASARAYLIKAGISAERIISKGYGESRLVNGCSDGVPCTEAQHQANRRTEVTVLSNQ
ncbi:OmpA family protein [Deminuibacter soli]|nr:OmpA family protein [Deminuibacter soli]